MAELEAAMFVEKIIGISFAAAVHKGEAFIELIIVIKAPDVVETEAG